jgi:hypothetical protein
VKGFGLFGGDLLRGLLRRLLWGFLGRAFGQNRLLDVVDFGVRISRPIPPQPTTTIEGLWGFQKPGFFNLSLRRFTRPLLDGKSRVLFLLHLVTYFFLRDNPPIMPGRIPAKVTANARGFEMWPTPYIVVAGIGRGGGHHDTNFGVKTHQNGAERQAWHVRVSPSRQWW